jgi:hypothetical protein
MSAWLVVGICLILRRNTLYSFLVPFKAETWVPGSGSGLRQRKISRVGFSQDCRYARNRSVVQQDGHPRLRFAPAAGPRPYANQFPLSSGLAPLAGPMNREL